MNLTHVAIGCLLLSLLLMFGFVMTEAQNDFMTVKPFVASLLPAPNQLKIQTIDFTRGYNITSSRWDNVTVTVLNAGFTNATGGQVYAELYNVNGTRIAYGQRGLDPIQPNMAFSISVPLAWNENTTIADYAFGKITAT